MKNNHHHTFTKNTTKSGLLRTVCIIAMLTLILSCVTCFQSGAATNAGSAKAIQAQAKTYSGNYLYCTADDFVALRKSASAGSTELARIPHGKKMTYLNSKSGQWYYVKYRSQKGYVYEDYVTFDADNISSKSASSSSSDNTAAILYCTADDFVSLRKSPSASSTELAKIPRGNKMGYLNKKSGKWYYVNYNSQKGYVYSDYVSAKNPNAGSSTKSYSSYNSRRSSGSYVPDYSYNYKSHSKCSRCNGTGTVVCSSCHGSKKQSHTHYAPSFGFGSSKRYTTYSKCYACSGKGTTRCTLCGGDGYV